MTDNNTTIAYNDIRSPEYHKGFWKMMRGTNAARTGIEGNTSRVNAYDMPVNSAIRFNDKLAGISKFRNIATVHYVRGGGSDIFAAVNESVSAWIAEDGSFPIENIEADFSEIAVSEHKLGAAFKIPRDFVCDASFNVENYISDRFARSFDRAEENAFISGTGVNEPTGILHETLGGETGVSTDAITFDSIIELFFSLKPEYRDNAVWMMNDNTAMLLRKLKDDDGNYIWNYTNDTILGKKVIISNYMPDAEDGKKPVAFGDFSFYWIVDRDQAKFNCLDELYATEGKLGYIGYEFTDAKLIRPEAIKVLEIANS